MRYIDVCSGISAPTMAWKPLGWEAACFAEIEPAPRAVLAHHYPNTPLHGDFTQIRGDEHGTIDLLVGGTPCQSFSVAGLRGGLGDDRGNLALEFLRLADRARPRWVVWENVPGVLSSGGGRDFGAILGGLVELGYGFAYRVLDAQFFGVPQRRRRVFVVGYSGNWRRATAVLSERHGLQGHPAPRRQAGQGIAGCLSPGAHPGGFNGQDAYNGQLIAHARDVAAALTSNYGKQPDSSDTALGPNLVAFGWQNSPSQGLSDSPHTVPTLDKSKTPAVAFPIDPIRYGGSNQDTLHHESGVHSTLPSGNNNNAGHYTKTVAGSAVRRLTPRECERLQGFPDDFTLVPYRGGMMKDGPRYKMLGNSMAVPVVRWIGERIQAVEAMAIAPEAEAA